MRDEQNLIAHVRRHQISNKWLIHSLIDHLKGVSKLAASFCEPFENNSWGKIAGFLHDFGKGSNEFQSYIRDKTGYDINAHIEDIPGKVNHSSHGAVWSTENIGGIAGKVLSYIISGHHAGLPDWYHEIGVGGNLEHRLSDAEKNKLPQISHEFSDQISANLDIKDLNPPCGSSIPSEFLHLWIRFMFSALVDADFLDTEFFMNPEQYENRNQYPDLMELKRSFDVHMDVLVSKADSTIVNSIRKNILDICRLAGCKKEHGFFSITVPTGGGKTLSVMAFALEHAIRLQKRRVIVAIPYTSIIEQTAAEYKKIFGENNVIEHHSNIDPDKESLQSRLAAENWDAPIIVTTNVQLFESLFAYRTSTCRKLHNIANSVVILDEVQMLPPEYLRPIVKVMNSLVEFFKVTMVFSTATQPALTGKIGSGENRLMAIEKEKVHEVISDPDELSKNLQRVQLEFSGSYETWKDLADVLAGFEKVLCIVNTRRDCRDLYEEMPKDTIHLSANMCAEHRSDVIANIKKKLMDKKPVRVISTQLVEAGVDIDFPVVFRALSGFDSITQAAGRCNREGKLNGKGRVVVFNPPKEAPPGLLRKASDSGQELFKVDLAGCKELRPQTIKRYFEIFYSKVNSFDIKNIETLLEKDAEGAKIQFRSAAKRFKLIDEENQIPVVVRYDGSRLNSNELISQLGRNGPDRKLLRKLQRFTVNLPEKLFLASKTGMVKVPDTDFGIWCQESDGLYHPDLGFVGLDLQTDNDLFFI